MDQQHSYFRCEWKIPSLSADEIRKTFIGTGNENCGLFFEAPTRNAEGYWTVGVVARVTSRAILDEYISNHGAEAGLLSWVPVEEDWTKWRSLTMSAAPDFMRGIQHFGQANAELDQK